MLINKIKFKAPRFNSGELKLSKDFLMSFVKDNSVDILYNRDEISLFELQMICNYYTSNNIKTNLILTYLPYQRMDHKGNNSVESVKHVAQIFNSLNLNSIKICEPHCDLTHFNNSSKIKIVELLFEKVKKIINFNDEKDVLVFTDKGSFEKFNYFGKNKAFCSKERDKKTGWISSLILSGQLKDNQKIVILDDIVSSGDTIMETLSEIGKQVKTEVFVVTAHYENNKFNKRLIESKSIKKIFSTNSLKKKGNKKLILFKMEELLK